MRPFKQKAHPLCRCGLTKKDHYKNDKCIYQADKNTKNVIPQKKDTYKCILCERGVTHSNCTDM